MDKGLVDLAELRKMIGKTKYEGKSSFGFKIGNKFVKVYAREEDRKYDIFSPPIVTKIVDFSGFNADTIVFPNEYIYENGLKAGEIADFIPNKRYDLALDEKVILNRMIESYEDVISDLYLFDNINMEDLCYVNILYSNRNGFHIIDTTDWFFQENSIKKNIYRFNMGITKPLIYYLAVPSNLNSDKFNEDFLNSLQKYGTAGNKLVDSLLLIDQEKYNFLKFIYAYMDVYRIHYGEDAKTLKDVKELTKVIKKG